MADDDLNQPLRGRAPKSGRQSRPFIAAGLISITALLILLAGVWIAVVDDPLGGQPVAVAAIQDPGPPTTGALPGARAGGNKANPVPGSVEVAGLPLLPDPLPAAAPPADMIEQSAFGPLPKIGASGLKPMDAYRAKADTPAGKPRIVLVVSGLGLSQTGTQEAINVLPAGVTLAFAPYGSSLQRWVDKARESGHEVLLQVPMEPEGYPQTNPGEHTLLAAAADANAGDADLDWALGRMTSYAGVMNYMGGRFTGDRDALGNFLVDVAQRGLFYLDDGSSPDSLAKELGGEMGAPVVAADAILDSSRDPEKIQHALANLEAVAQAQGTAVGVATAFPSSIATLAAWASGAESRGFAIVPASAVLKR